MLTILEIRTKNSRSRVIMIANISFIESIGDYFGKAICNCSSRRRLIKKGVIFCVKKFFRRLNWLGILGNYWFFYLKILNMT